MWPMAAPVKARTDLAQAENAREIQNDSETHQRNYEKDERRKC